MWFPVCGKIIRCLIGILSQEQPPAAGPGLPSCLMCEGRSVALEVGQSTEVGATAGGGGLGTQVGQSIFYLFLYSCIQSFSK